jgi:ketosteroid isomerase-like protein
VGFYADDAISMPDDAPALVGKAAIQKDIEADFASSKNQKTVTYETVEVFGDENRVTETGTVVAKDATGKVAFTEKYMQIWEKRKGGWQVIREIYNHDSKVR